MDEWLKDLTLEFQGFVDKIKRATGNDAGIAIEGDAAWPTTSNKIVGNTNNAEAGKFGYSRKKGGNKKWHGGVDIGNNEGESVFAFSSGKVIRASWQNPGNHNAGFGKRIVIEHKLKTDKGADLTIYSVYGHLKTMSVSANDAVTAGQLIGTVGRTGNAHNHVNTHLHFEIRKGSYPGTSTNNLDPASLFDFESKVNQFLRCLGPNAVCEVPETKFQ